MSNNHLYKRRLSNAQLAELIERWVNDPKPNEYKYGYEYDVHPRTIWRWISKLYYGKVRQATFITKQSKINEQSYLNKRNSKRINVPAVDEQTEHDVLDLYVNSNYRNAEILAILCHTTITKVNQIITNYLTFKYNEEPVAHE